MDNKIYYYLDELERLRKGEWVPPISCEIDPSNRSMLDCEFCMFEKYRKLSGENLDLNTYISLVGELHNMGTKSITFTGGGEPLLNPNFNLMVNIALALGFEIGLVTNGILLHKLENISKFKFIRVSLDAHNRHDYLKVKRMDFFDKVIENISISLKYNPTIGISYVVCPDNKNDLQKAEELASNLGVAYIQIKPAYINGNIFSNFNFPDGRPTIETKRYKPVDNIPCTIAGLVGIVGADSNVYFCCQHRGKSHFTLGNLKERSFKEIWYSRMKLIPDVSKCPSCRYMNYTRAYNKILKDGNLFFQHRYFL
jgi:MoaA/NifB/PqqE/SkfB family radical SAM enzyme